MHALEHIAVAGGPSCTRLGSIRALTSADAPRSLTAITRRSWCQEVRAVARLLGRRGNVAAARHALTWRQRLVALHVPDQEFERHLRMRLDKFQLREAGQIGPVLVTLDVIAVLDLVEPILRLALVVVAFSRCVDHRLISA